MRTHFLIAAIAAVMLYSHAHAQVLWEAYNDYRPTENTHPNVTGYDLRVTDDGGPLVDFANGEFLNVSVRVEVETTGNFPDDFGLCAYPDPGTPAHELFDGKVDMGNDGLPGLRSSLEHKLTLVFEGLDPAKRYNFRGTVVRGGSYNDRWSLFGITGTESYVTAHEDASLNQNLFTKATFPGGTLEPHQVALNSGHNKAGSLVGWDNIVPDADGTFRIEAQQYTGPAPFGNPSAAPYGYGFNAIYLAELQAAGQIRITEAPASQLIAGGGTATFSVAASSPDPITYQWQRAAPGTTNFVDIEGATQATYTTPVLTAADHESRFRVRLASGGAETITSEAVLQVDAVLPAISSVRGSINFNVVYVTFSEAMKLATLADKDNFQLSGGVTINSAVAFDPVTAQLATSPQTIGAPYTLTVNNVEDLAGNKIAANTAVNFNAFNVVSNTVGAEMWLNINGAAVQTLRDNPRYPDNPDVDYPIATFDSFLIPLLQTDLNRYGGRMRAWITPEETGEYEFFIGANKQAELRISTDDKFDNFEDPDFLFNFLPEAWLTTSSTFKEPGLDDSVSLPIPLEAGRRYAMQALWKEENGLGDFLQIAWRKLGDETPAEELQPIPSRFLSYYGPAATTPSGSQFTRVALEGGNITIEWTGGTMLQSSGDLATWTDEPTARSPLSVSPVGRKFYRVRN